jgi:hypothetical protein
MTMAEIEEMSLEQLQSARKSAAKRAFGARVSSSEALLRFAKHQVTQEDLIRTSQAVVEATKELRRIDAALRTCALTRRTAVSERRDAQTRRRASEPDPLP